MKQRSHVTCGRKSTRSGCWVYNKKQEGARPTINLLPGVVGFYYYSFLPPPPHPRSLGVFHSNFSFFQRPKLPVFFPVPLFMWCYLCLPVMAAKDTLHMTSVNAVGIHLFCVACSGLFSLRTSGLQTLFLLFSNSRWAGHKHYWSKTVFFRGFTDRNGQ
jgi:hypothetical protein